MYSNHYWSRGLVLVFVSLMACGGIVDEPSGDAGRITSPRDAGVFTTVDAGLVSDAGVNPVDAGTLVDAGFTRDAGTRPPSPDSGTPAVTLEWDASTTSGVSYSVYRGTSAGGPYVLIASGVASTSYSDTTVHAGVTYFYVTRAVDATQTQSIDSNETTVTP